MRNLLRLNAVDVFPAEEKVTQATWNVMSIFKYLAPS